MRLHRLCSTVEVSHHDHLTIHVSVQHQLLYLSDNNYSQPCLPFATLLCTLALLASLPLLVSLTLLALLSIGSLLLITSKLQAQWLGQQSR